MKIFLSIHSKQVSVRLIILFLVFFSFTSPAQILFRDLSWGLGVEQFVSGNWHGSFYGAHLSVRNDCDKFFAGPIIQKRSLEMTGFKAGYSRVLFGKSRFERDCEGDLVDGNLQLNAFCYLQYTKQTRLSYTSIIIEERSNRKDDYNWNKLRLNTGEICMGFELYYKITDQICWRNYFGICVYEHFTYKTGMYHEKISPVLLLGTGISLRQF